jgi:hypothetical protein
MPCMDYRDTPGYTETYKEMRDQLARIACKAMAELERLDPENKLFKDREAGPWYRQHKIDDAIAKEKERALRKERADRKKAKDQAMAKLTEEDKKALGIR